MGLIRRRAGTLERSTSIPYPHFTQFFKSSCECVAYTSRAAPVKLRFKPTPRYFHSLRYCGRLAEEQSSRAQGRIYPCGAPGHCGGGGPSPMASVSEPEKFLGVIDACRCVLANFEGKLYTVVTVHVCYRIISKHASRDCNAYLCDKIKK
jgi:hypothetical protein